MSPSPGNGMPDNSGQDEPDPRLLWRWVGRASRPWVGWVFIGLGALLVLLGYLGVSREAIVEKQIPYLVSGGIGGVLLCVVGAYFLGTEELRKDSGRLDRLEPMVEELHAALLDAARRAGASADATATNGHGDADAGRRRGRRDVPPCGLRDGRRQGGRGGDRRGGAASAACARARCASRGAPT